MKSRPISLDKEASRPMGASQRLPSKYRAMWLFALFDLPVRTKPQRKLANRFRNELLRNGFCRIQYSIYAQYCSSEEAAEAKRRVLRSEIPGEGQVRLISITDTQFGKMEVFTGKTVVEPENAPTQLEFF